jgi:hypothetical protein
LECTGLSHREIWGRWSIGNTVRIRFREKLQSSFKLILNLVDVFGPNVHKKIKVKCGSQEAENILEPIELCSSYNFQFESVNSDTVEIFVPHPFRPKDIPELGNEDSRKIGIGIRSVFINPPKSVKI